MSWETNNQKRAALNTDEGAGEVADSMEVRRALIRRMDAGELTLEQVQAELRRIKRTAKVQGKVTRRQAFERGAEVSRGLSRGGTEP